MQEKCLFNNILKSEHTTLYTESLYGSIKNTLEKVLLH